MTGHLLAAHLFDMACAAFAVSAMVYAGIASTNRHQHGRFHPRARVGYHARHGRP